jgi:hypothetical protein
MIGGTIDNTAAIHIDSRNTKDKGSVPAFLCVHESEHAPGLHYV